jgi:Ca2+-binding EF-hand superfamily protein
MPAGDDAKPGTPEFRPPGDAPGKPEGSSDKPGGPEGHGRMIEDRFRSLDKNTDGKLEAAELPHPEMLAHADGDKDGAVTLDEYRTAMMKMRGDRPGGDGAKPPKSGGRKPMLSREALRRFDQNQDGKVERSEFAGGDERFDAIDLNKDGVLTADDLPKTDAPASGNAKVAELDKDKNGRLSREEFPGSDDDWRRLDRNQDGWIDAAETGEDQQK